MRYNKHVVINSRPDPLLALSPLDGRYVSQTTSLRKYFSESALIGYRIRIEVLYLIELVRFLGVAKISQTEEKQLTAWAQNLTLADMHLVKNIEAKIRHDVKAVEYFIVQNLARLKLERLTNWVHWGLTSDDLNNLTYGLMVKEAKNEVMVPAMKKLIRTLLLMARQYKTVPMPARTHGQIAVPTTVGKELVVFASRAAFFYEKIANLKPGGKLNGAVGNYNSFVHIFPHKNWRRFSRLFIRKIGLEPTLITTQIEPYTRTVYLLDLCRQMNNVWLDLACDCWQYISFDYFVQTVVGREVGSSTMPHKVNPIHFENAEGNLHLANGLLQTLANKLPLSRLQRDLSDSTVRRSLGVAFGYSLLAMHSLVRGLKEIRPNDSLLKQEMESHPEMLTEALQLILKVWGEKQAYEKVKGYSRGKQNSWADLIRPYKPAMQKKLRTWKVEKYTGLAASLTALETNHIYKILGGKK